jgi:hypothetical protein
VDRGRENFPVVNVDQIMRDGKFQSRPILKRLMRGPLFASISITKTPCDHLLLG